MDSMQIMKKSEDWQVVDKTRESEAASRIYNPAERMKSTNSDSQNLYFRWEHLKVIGMDPKDKQRLKALKNAIPAEFQIKDQAAVRSMSKSQKKEYKKNLDKYEEWIGIYNKYTIKERTEAAGSAQADEAVKTVETVKAVKAEEAYKPSTDVSSLMEKAGYNDIDISEDVEEMEDALSENEKFDTEEYKKIVELEYQDTLKNNPGIDFDASLGSYKTLNYSTINKNLDTGRPYGMALSLLNGLRYAKLPMDIVTARGSDMSELSALLDGIEGFEGFDELERKEQLELLQKKLDNNETITFYNKRAVSTSRDIAIADSFANRSAKDIRVEFIILNKKGTNALDISLKEGKHGMAKEKEILISPGSKFKIIGVKADGAIPRIYLSTQQDDNFYDGTKYLKKK